MQSISVLVTSRIRLAALCGRVTQFCPMGCGQNDVGYLWVVSQKEGNCPF